MSDKVRVAVVGVGFFGERHARAFSEIQNAQLVAVVDADLKRAEAIAKQ